MTMVEEEAWVARYLPGFGNPREMHADDFHYAMKAINTILSVENSDPSDSRQFVERSAREARRG